MVIPKLPMCWSRNPGIGSGRRSNTIPQIVNPRVPNNTRAIPDAFRMAAIVDFAKIAVIRPLHSKPPEAGSMSVIAVLQELRGPVPNLELQ
jgi:hypothetical protein